MSQYTIKLVKSHVMEAITTSFNRGGFFYYVVNKWKDQIEHFIFNWSKFKGTKLLNGGISSHCNSNIFVLKKQYNLHRLKEDNGEDIYYHAKG